jgi:hypothetical protein
VAKLMVENDCGEIPIVDTSNRPDSCRCGERASMFFNDLRISS